jgi:hypothetical protein
VQTILQRADQATEVKTTQRLPLDLARRLETDLQDAVEDHAWPYDAAVTVSLAMSAL